LSERTREDESLFQKNQPPKAGFKRPKKEIDKSRIAQNATYYGFTGQALSGGKAGEWGHMLSRHRWATTHRNDLASLNSS
jgi:hypothetical protein